MGYLTVYLKTSQTNLQGFNQENNYTLKFDVPHGSSVQDLLNNFNSHRRPSKQIHQVVSKNGEIANQQVIKKDSIFFVK